MGLIRITPETLQSQANTLRKENEQHEATYQRMKQLVASLMDEWQGDTQKAFQDSFNQKEAFFKQFAEEIAKFAQFMDTTAERMRATEDELRSQAQKLA